MLKIMLMLLMVWGWGGRQAMAFEKDLKSTSADWEFQTSGSVEKIEKITDGWRFTAGGVVADTHYSRVKYLLPEKVGVAPTTFYMRAEVVLPVDFYDRQNAGFRIMNTSNWHTTLNGKPVGTTSEDIFTSVYFRSDHSLRVQSSWGNIIKNFYTMPGRLAVGKHVLELYGDVANVAPWYLKIDGVVVATGVDRLSPDETPANERMVTRMVVGIDGAASLSNNSMSVEVGQFVIADHDLNQSGVVISKGDFNKDGVVNLVDFGFWKTEYLGGRMTLIDFVNWKTDYLKL